MRSIEQAVRDILEQAIRDGLVSSASDLADPDPQCRSSGELVGCANVLVEYLRESAASAAR